MAEFTDIVSTEKQAELEGKYGDLRGLKHNSKPLAVLLREPKLAEYKRYRAGALNERSRPEAQELLFRQLCVWPETPGEVQQLLERWPGCPEACTVIIEKLTGLTGAEQGKE
jgi:hypothetical protein